MFKNLEKQLKEADFEHLFHERYTFDEVIKTLNGQFGEDRKHQKYFGDIYLRRISDKGKILYEIWVHREKE